ncbi:MAG: hypothetical protein U0165_01665 [Polyangiaceae bacterium]
MSPKHPRTLLIVLMLCGGPILLAIDLLAQRMILSGQPEDLRELVGGYATRFAWGVVPLPVIGGVIGFFLYPRVVKKQLARRTSTTPLEQAERNADMIALMLCASIPQLPALLGDISVMMGASLTPVMCSTSLSMIAVLSIALLGPKRVEKPVE